MKNQLLNLWHKLGSIHLTVVLCLLLTADLVWGYVCLHRHLTLFSPLNDIGLQAWLMTYGRYNLSFTAWFFMLLGLLFLLCVNTFVCTTDRIIRLVQSRSKFTAQRLFFKFAPHVMHYALILILVGYLVSYLFSQVLDTRTLVPGAAMTLPGTDIRITFQTFAPGFYKGERLSIYHNRSLQPKATLLISKENRHTTAVLGYNQPIRHGGFCIFLKNFSPKQKKSMGGNTRIDISIRKDPGVRWYFAGIFLFTMGLLMYVVDRLFVKKTKKEDLWSTVPN